ncbi:DUF4173 domain-containing protein [Parerythrobacter aurantius]|uniref:DUF4153 domain-containing protein n=1 Tax=Parerythrobacter aurantius TaxID=3127706 RepID=UPI0032508EE4
MARLPKRFRGTFLFKLVLAASIVAAGDRLLFVHELLPAGLGAVGLGLAAALALGQPASWSDRKARAALCLAAIYALAMIFDASPLAFALFWVALGLAVLLPRTVAFDDGWRWSQRLIRHALASAIGPLADAVRVARIRRLRGSDKGSVRDLAAVVVVPLVGTLLFVWLFAIANPVIDGWIASLRLPEPDEYWLARVFVWLVLGWVAWAVLRPRQRRPLFGTFDGRGDLRLPGLSSAAVLLSLVAFNAVFLLQNAMDAAWLWGLLPLSPGISLAEYAHRGAYPLVATALLTALFVLVALRPGSINAGQPIVRRLVSLWIGQNLFLLFNAALRTLDYVAAYSLTVLRIAALLWMVLVATGLLLVLWRMLAGKSAAWLINANLASAGIVLTATCFVDLGAIAAQWNVRHAREAGGKGAALDLCYLHSLGGSALLPLIELEQRTLGSAFGERVARVRHRVHFRLVTGVRDGEWQILDQYRLWRAASLLGTDPAPQPASWRYGCDGILVSVPAPVAAAITPVPRRAPSLTQGRER